MKPDEEMHAGAEEVELEPSDFFVDIATLIIEGRVPGLSERGFGEGPHCRPLHGQNRHVCDQKASQDCQQYEQLEKHMLLLWKNGIPMSVEVLLYPDCCQPSGRNVQVETSSVPDTSSCTLLEQWTLHMPQRRIGMAEARILPKGLLQAVRSFLHFSQLSAWLSLGKGKITTNIHYRICVPGEAFSTKFNRSPEVHSFPVANVGRNHAMKVTIKSLPRQGEFPKVPCTKHDGHGGGRSSVAQTASVSSAAAGLGEFKVRDFQRFPERPSKEKDYRENKGKSSLAVSKTSLGDCLLDPPQSLSMYSKRYQSPSREAPERLMFGLGASTSSSSSQLDSFQPQNCKTSRPNVSVTRDRSRPQRRPVVERFLKKQYGVETAPPPLDNVSNPDCDRTSTRGDQTNLEETRVKSLYYPGKYPPPKEMSLDDRKLEGEEMRIVLDNLKQRYPASKLTMMAELEGKKTTNTTDSLNDQIWKSIEKEESGKYFKRTIEKTKDNRRFRENLLRGNDIRPDAMTPNLSSLSLNKKHSKEFLDSDSYPPSAASKSDTTEREILKEEKCIEAERTCKAEEMEEDSNGATSERNSSKDILLNNSQSINASKRILGRNYAYLYYKMLKSNINLPTRDDEGSESPDKNGHLIPSAAEKLKFRRSLDSATCMVFHQNTGLPLTSSPAPIRKSGTCFDFDSSLTSVAAIKKALFEKDPELDEETKRLLSSGSPASTTTSNLLGNFEESVLNGRLEPVSTVEGFTAEIGASGSFCPRHKTLPVTVFFYTLHDVHNKVTSPYLGHINLGRKGYNIPKKGTVQVTLFNPHRTVVKMFVVQYDLSDMPPLSQTFLRQRTLYMPTGAGEDDQEARKWLRYLIHLRFASSKSGKIYLHTDVRMIIFRKSDLDAATIHGERPYELRSFTQGPKNPKFSPCK